jgi:hypothetical protein
MISETPNESRTPRVPALPTGTYIREGSESRVDSAVTPVRGRHVSSKRTPQSLAREGTISPWPRPQAGSTRSTHQKENLGQRGALKATTAEGCSVPPT